MPRRLQIARATTHPLLLALLLTAVAVAAVASLTAVLMLSPALVLLALLLTGHAPGEQLILRLQSRRRPRRRRGPTTLPVRRYAALYVRATDRMSASALAMRPPPARACRIA